MTPTHKRDIVAIFAVLIASILIRTFYVDPIELRKFALIALVVFNLPIYFLFYKYFQKEWVRWIFILMLLTTTLLYIGQLLSGNAHSIPFQSIMSVFFLFLIIYLIWIRKFPMDPHQERPSKENRRFGILLVASPFIFMLFILTFWILFGVVLSSYDIELTKEIEAVMTTINHIFQILLFISLYGLLPLGFRYAFRIEPDDNAWDKRSGMRRKSEIPKEIQKWNWGAAGFGFIWGAYHKTALGIFTTLPIINVIFMIILGFKGNKWAWQRNKWKGTQHFMTAQKKWKPWGIVFFVLLIVFDVLLLVYANSVFVR